MSVQPSRALTGALVAGLGALGLSTAWPGLSILSADSGVCLQVNPAQSWIGVHFHLLVPSSACPQGTYAPGPALVTADMAYQIDNMEGIGVHKNAQGETI